MRRVVGVMLGLGFRADTPSSCVDGSWSEGSGLSVAVLRLGFTLTPTTCVQPVLRLPYNVIISFLVKRGFRVHASGLQYRAQGEEFGRNDEGSGLLLRV